MIADMTGIELFLWIAAAIVFGPFLLKLAIMIIGAVSGGIVFVTFGLLADIDEFFSSRKRKKDEAKRRKEEYDLETAKDREVRNQIRENCISKAEIIINTNPKLRGRLNPGRFDSPHSFLWLQIIDSLPDSEIDRFMEGLR